MADVLWVDGLQVGVLLLPLTIMGVFRDYLSFTELINGTTHCAILCSEAEELVLTLVKCLSCLSCTMSSVYQAPFRLRC